VTLEDFDFSFYDLDDTRSGYDELVQIEKDQYDAFELLLDPSQVCRARATRRRHMHMQLHAHSLSVLARSHRSLPSPHP